MFKSKLNCIRKDLTDSEQIIADYILNHLSECRSITSSQLSRAAYVSQSSVIRFSQKLGYKSFRELLSDLSLEDKSVDINEEIGLDEDIEASLEKVARQEQEIIDLTLRCNGKKEIARAVERIRKADLCICFGKSSSNLYAKYLANQLEKIGINTMSADHEDLVYVKINNASKNTVVILISEAGNTDLVVKVARLAREKGLFVISMTRNHHNQLYDLSDIVLKTVAFDTRTKLNVTTTRVSQLYLIDVIYILLMKEDFERYGAAVDENEKLTGKRT